MTLKNLRFFVAIEDVDLLAKSQNLAPDFVKILLEFQKMAESINSLGPNLKFGQRRKHALLGQDIFVKFGVIQYDESIKQEFLDLEDEDEEHDISCGAGTHALKEYFEE